MKRRAPKITFADLPRRLQPTEGESREQKAARYRWLEEHGLTVVDFLGWWRDQDPRAALSPPARRKLMTAKQRAALDAQREREGAPAW